MFYTTPTIIAKGSAEHHERNDCTVRALSTVLGVSYDLAHRLCEATGRTAHKGHYMDKLVKCGRLIGVEFTDEKVPSDSITQRALPHFYATGRFLVATKHHCFCIVDGKVYDAPRKNKFIEVVYKVEKVKSIADQIDF